MLVGVEMRHTRAQREMPLRGDPALAEDLRGAQAGFELRATLSISNRGYIMADSSAGAQLVLDGGAARSSAITARVLSDGRGERGPGMALPAARLSASDLVLSHISPQPRT